MRKILIPTDFSVDSLQLIDYAVINFPDTKLDIILTAGYRLPDRRWDITHFSESEQIRKFLSDDFTDAKRRVFCEHKNNIATISFQLFTGVNSFAFQNLLEQLNTKDAVIPKDNVLYCPNNKWFDTTGFIKSNVTHVVEAPVELKKEVSHKTFSLIRLFNL